MPFGDRLGQGIPGGTMGRLKLWLDRQLVVQSWPGTGLSPLNWLVLILILLSTVTFTIETEPDLPGSVETLLGFVNVVIILVFCAEFFARILSAGETIGLEGFSDRSLYAGRGWLVIDFVAFAPEGVLLLILAFGLADPVSVSGLKAIRLLRLLKLIKFLPGGRLVTEVLSEVMPQLVVSLLAALGLVYGAAVLIYYAEGAVDSEHFGSVTRSLWWSVVTLTTVGYGDVYPHTVIGKVIAGLIAILGVGIIALPSGIIAGAFMDKLQTERAKNKKQKSPQG